MPNTLSREWSRTTAAIGGRRISLHALRHTHASSLIAAGVDILTVSRRLGHANPTITLGVYGHLYVPRKLLRPCCRELERSKHKTSPLPVAIRWQFRFERRVKTC